MPIREVQGVPIVAWQQPDAIQTAPAELRGFFSEREGVERLLLDLSACEDLNASSMEALTEAFRVCADRKARVGMFGLNFSTLQLIEILGLHTNLPPHMGETEAEAVAKITSNGAAPPPPPPPAQELTFEVPPATGGVELEFDLESEPATKKPVDIEFDLDVGTAPTARFDPAAVAEATGTSVDVGLTTILWNDLASQGYVIGGEGADEIMAAAASTQVAPTPAAAPAAGAPVGAPGIDFGDLEPAGGASDEDESDEGASWTAAPAAPAGTIDFGSPGAGSIDFGAPPPDPAAAPAGAFGAPPPGGAFGGAAMVSSGLFGAPQGDFSPVDSGAGAPPAAVAQAGPPPGAPVPGGMGGIAPDDDVPDDSNETIMFAPGALDQALAEAAAKAAAEAAAAPDPTPAAPPEPVVPVAEPAPVAAAPAPAAPAPTPEEESGFYASDNETVMIQPGMLDAALLAEVAKAAGEETATPAPPVEEPQAAPPPATNTVPTGDELAVRLFVLDQGIKSDLHIEVLGRLLKFEKVIGPEDLKIEGDVRSVLDQFAQSRLLRRQRSARVRGGNGFVLSASPAARGTVTRLWRMWSNPQGRAKLSAWVREG